MFWNLNSITFEILTDQMINSFCICSSFLSNVRQAKATQIKQKITCRILMMFQVIRVFMLTTKTFSTNYCFSYWPSFLKYFAALKVNARAGKMFFHFDLP